MKIEIRNRWDNKIILCGEYESVKDCLEKNRGADLEGANLRGADLEGANLEGAKNYSHSHDFAIEIIRRQELETFTEKEWAIIGQVYVHRLCWDDIKKEYGELSQENLKIRQKETKRLENIWRKDKDKFLEEIKKGGKG